MLIKCPECNKDISSEAEKCIFCGYPLNIDLTDKNISEINGTRFDLTKELLEATSTETPVVLIKKLKERCALDFNGAHQLYKIMRETKQVPPTFNSNSEAIQQNIPKCPTCGSPNIEKISLPKKAVGGLAFGLFSSNIRNTMHCKNCGAKW
ncbi:zinc-ribbon domain [Clostridium sp. ASBs410]|nr:zinc-ribbon domain [Clostridium sp. ASBs410]